ncbi:MAG: DNA-binding protein [Abditibacteriota bacterium]|nr:DNA-binding protein [Abditibacteriota bacterium]
MDHKQYGDTVYIRVDKGENVIDTILWVCKKENIKSAVFSGIGGCDRAEVMTFDPAAGDFRSETIEGMLELVSLNGNVIWDESEDRPVHHTHGLFAFVKDGEHRVRGGHLKDTRVLYTCEIELRPVEGGTIRKVYDPETGTGFWKLQ